MSEQGDTHAGPIDLTANANMSMRRAMESVNTITEAVRSRDAKIAQMTGDLNAMHRAMAEIQAKLMEVTSERDHLSKRVDLVDGEYRDYMRRTTALVRFVEEKCREIVEQDHRADGLFLRQEAALSNDEQRLNASARFREFREAFSPLASPSAFHDTRPQPTKSVLFPSLPGMDFHDSRFGGSSL